MLHVACVLWGSAFTTKYVEILHDMVRRNLAEGFRGDFTVFTDTPSAFSGMAGVTTRLLPPGAKGWWNKLYLFSEDAFPKGDRVLYFDLDTVITGPLDAIASHAGKDFAVLEDPQRMGGMNSSVMAWEAGTLTYIYEDWINSGRPEVAGGDQAWLEQKITKHHFLTNLFPGSLRSYKKECRSGIPAGTSVVYFHGQPRPHDADGWVPEVWRVGGGSSAELVLVGTVAQATILDNVATAIAKDYRQIRTYPEHMGTAVIVGGAPSLKDSVGLIANLQAGGALVFATNATAKFLTDRNVMPAFHVMVDARPEMAEMVVQGPTQLFASMMHPSVLDAATDLYTWHPLTEGIKDVAGKQIYVGGGTTVGCKALALAYVLGFRRFFMVGMDSSYDTTGAHHAYAQSLNDGERVLDVLCGGRKFKAAPWMVQQAEDLRNLVKGLAGCEFTCAGDGLFPHLFSTLTTDIINVDGLWWPASDVETAPAVLGTLGDLHHYIDLCRDKRVALQAGGNVGVWPKELSKHFATVHTFEPDALNYKCLVRNVDETNVVAHHEALGDEAGYVSMEHVDSNCGASSVKAGTDVAVRTIDSLGLEALDLLQLDVEGYELKALKGARKTIDKFSPVIVLEQKHLGDKYGDSDEATAKWLTNLGYRRTGAMHRDVIYTRTH